MNWKFKILGIIYSGNKFQIFLTRANRLDHLFNEKKRLHLIDLNLDLMAKAKRVFK